MAFTEFYCTTGGSNLNSGTTTGNSATYTSTNGNWNGTTIFTPTDGSTPASTVSVGDFASVFLDAATQGVFVARVVTVAAGVNGAITVSGTNQMGSAPTSGATGRSIKVGGAFKGPQAGNLWPTTGSFTNMVNTSSDPPRLNLKNDQTYSISTGITFSGTNLTVQGYSGSVNDGGRATIDGSTNVIGIILGMPATGSLIDLVCTSSAASGTNDVITASSSGNFRRITASGGRGFGFNLSTSTSLYECESNNNNKANTSGKAGITVASNSIIYRCIVSGNTGSNTDGILVASNSGPVVITQCAIFTNGRHGIALQSAGISSPQFVSQNDIYNNGGDGIKNLQTTTHSTTIIENNNLVKNTGWGINSALTTGFWFGDVRNNGFGSGTQVNGSGSTNGTNNLSISGSVTYASNLTPWVDPANGDFRINLSAANFTGRGTFTETQGSYAGTVGYPDIGAAQALTGPGGTFSKEVSYGFA